MGLLENKLGRERFAPIVFYRDLHYPVCRRYLGEFAKLESEFKTRGVEVVAVSSDEEERARRATAEWQLGDLTVDYGLDLTVARSWWPFISSAVARPPPCAAPRVYFFRVEAYVLNDLAARCHGREVPDCPILDALWNAPIGDRHSSPR